ncbi:MAG: glycosyltransferase [Kiritimatiellia bacterium]
MPEAWACGLPVVAASEGGPAELITDRVNGLLVKVGDVEEIARAIMTVLQDKAMAIRLAGAGREKAEVFSLHHHARLVKDIYDRITG